LAEVKHERASKKTIGACNARALVSLHVFANETPVEIRSDGVVDEPFLRLVVHGAFRLILEHDLRSQRK
jgi:hypothetical protein